MADETTLGEPMDMVGDAGKLMMEAGGGAELVFESDAETGDPTRVALTLDGEVVVEGQTLEDVAVTVRRLRTRAGVTPRGMIRAAELLDLAAGALEEPDDAGGPTRGEVATALREHAQRLRRGSA